ncbi:MAG: HNH endonuclease [Dehalococcoidia bacterium]|nr:HNH endonuclease [Dehalococcoidia bacterium]
MITSGGYVLEHRYLVATSLGRPLERWEVVHHKNGIKDDNRLANLELMPSQLEHWPSVIAQSQFKVMETRVQTLEQRVLLLEAENTLLRASQQAQLVE